MNTILRYIGFYKDFTAETSFNSKLDFYRAFFTRQKEILNNSVTQCVRYESASNETESIFIGYKTESLSMPAGMVCFEFTDTQFSIISKNTKKKFEIKWQWIDPPTNNPSYPLGDFTLNSTKQKFSLTAFSYCKMGEIEDLDQVYLQDYNPMWQEKYLLFEHELRNQLHPDTATRIEHYGSTSIPGMCAKPVIDILLQTSSFEKARYLLALFNKQEWEYWWYNNHMTFVKREKFMGKRSLHLHVVTSDHQIWQGLVFRDYLRKHKDAAHEYSILKRRLSEKYKNDREEYTLAKTDFIQKILKLALD